MILLDHVSFAYDEHAAPALDDVTLHIKAGETLAVVGHNGSGKSTLAKLLNGLLLPTQGTVTVAGLDTRQEDKLLDIRRHVGMVFQNPDNQIVTTIVEEDVAFGPENLGVPPARIRELVDASLAQVGMAEFAGRAPHMLSGGQKQRIAIAGMLAMEPAVLVLDEATSMLDPQGSRDVRRIVGELNRERGMTIVMITQTMEEAAAVDRVAVLAQGKLMLLDTPRNVFAQAAKLRDWGLDVPGMVRLRDRLTLEGVTGVQDAITAEEMAHALCPLLLKN